MRKNYHLGLAFLFIGLTFIFAIISFNYHIFSVKEVTQGYAQIINYDNGTTNYEWVTISEEMVPYIVSNINIYFIYITIVLGSISILLISYSWVMK